MANEERHDQTEAGDPFSVFGELVNIHSESKRGVHLFQSKLNELLFELTMTKGEKCGVNETEKKLIKEAMTIYADNMARRQRAHDLINTAREAHDRQG